jgi:two-component system, chemotaxis family, protein-glutamate methylesterase/glutaminase
MSTAPRIVVADDSALMRRVVASNLRGAGFEIAGEAADGDEALALCRELRPDAMTLDLTMPGRDGLGVLRELGEHGPSVPTVVVSAFSPRHGARAVDALGLGAFELVAKPGGPSGIAAFGEELCAKVRAAVATSGRAPRSAPERPAAPAPAPAGGPTISRAAAALRAAAGPAVAERLVLIASSTGGPRALGELVPALPAPLGAAVAIVQHMPAGFTASLAARLDAASSLTVREAADGARLEPDTALLAAGGLHLRVDERRARLSDEAEIGGLRPRADLTIADAARAFGARLLLVVLTGMGRDGTAGAEEVRRHGGRVLVEAESTCTVYGMPRAVADAGLADAVLPLDELPAAIVRELTAGAGRGPVAGALAGARR